MNPDDIIKGPTAGQKLLPAPTDTRIVGILCQFDFDRVHRVMRGLNWTWPGLGIMEVPTLTEIKVTAVRLLREASISPTGYASTGGFVAERMTEGKLMLSFVVDSWDE